jgi:mxaA protein
MTSLLRPVAIACSLAISASLQGAAAADRVELLAPRAFGYLIGDTFTHQVRITLDPTSSLETASLPRPGPLTYWLDLVAVDLEDLGVSREAHDYRLLLRYQAFYAPLEPKQLATPALTLVVRNEVRQSELDVPAWPFLMSPLREIVARRGSSAMALQPDVVAGPHRLVLDQQLAVLSACAAIAAVIGLGWLRGWGPARRHQPFILAARKVARCLRASRAEAYREALLVLHRAFDAAAGQRLLADDLESFLARRPGFLALADEIAGFFAASRQTFFGAGEARAQAMFSASALEALTRRLAGLERSGA